jgi:putative aldouronate transport system permease protein
VKAVVTNSFAIKKRTIKSSFSDKMFIFFVYLLLTLALLIVLLPLIYVVSASFSSPKAVIGGEVWLFPVEPTLMGYEAVFKNQQLIQGFANSFFYMIVGTTVNLIMTMLCAYPLSRKEFYGRTIITGLFVFTMYFNGGLVPTYMMVKNLNLLNTRWAMIIPTAMSVWNMIIARTYLQNTVPDALFEAASIDGCTEIGFLFRMVIPLSAPIIAVLALYYGVGHWNSYFNALIYLKSQKLMPLQIILRNILILGNVDPVMIQDVEALARKQGLADLLKYAVIVVASVPVLCIYPFVQKYFVKGVMIGALKG